MAIEKRRIGQVDLEVTAIGLGCATLGGSMESSTESDARTLVLDALAAGLNYFDTAPFYGYGKSEHVVGDVLRWHSDTVISTKVGRLLKPRRRPQRENDQWKKPLPFEPVFDYSYDGIMRSYEDSMQRMGMNRIDILYIHDVDVYSHGSKERQEKVFRQAMDETYMALDELRRSGEIKAIGLGVNEASPIAEAMKHGQWDVFLLAGRYTLLEQAPLETLFPEVEKHGASIVIGGPFNSGVLVGREIWNYSKAPADVLAKVKRIADVCDAHKVPLAAAAVQFPLAHPLVASVIPGPHSAAELNQIKDWWATPIPAGLWSDLKGQGLLDKSSPVPA